ncbi:GNAT family N-acetyltransferase [Chengkuizengella sediminis]|uniref:GNAT family N-acetyltransferase n=1 Tax=Chengkuizengella sediminis TaxID=1885917 RepID=UPI00138A2364|nr:GNAT family protein [Chengkuizengella sediminis]NDI37255.1 GNAT family N-acetyltransferase [Chengkuizengella sediminis]
MDLIFKKMTQKQAEEIAFSWHYEGKYSFYNMEADKEDLEEFLDPKKRGDSYFVVIQENEIIGFFCFNKLDDNTIDIGLGMKPELTGRGKGYEFLKEGIQYVNSKYKPEKITLSVATFNQRAVNVYKKIGFEEIKTFIQDTNGSNFEFVKMKYVC